jgi:cell division protease FtsH
MVSEYGMSEAVGPLSLGRDDRSNPFAVPKISGHTAEAIDQEVARLLNEAHDRAERILHDKRVLLDRLSGLLLVTETIDGTDLEAYATGTKPIPDPQTARENGEAAKAAAAAMRREGPVDEGAAAGRVTTPPTPPMPRFEE